MQHFYQAYPGVGRSRISAALSLVLVLGLTLLLAACGESSQGGEKTYEVGVYIDANSGAFINRLDGLKDGMKALGYTEGKNINYHVVQIKDMTADQEQATMKDFAAKNYDAYWLVNAQPTLKLKTMVTQKPIIVAGMPDPVETGIVKSVERPGVNISGVDNLNIKLTSKRLELLNKMDPTIRSVYFVYNMNSTNQKIYLQGVRDQAAKLGITLIEKNITTRDESARIVPEFKSSEAQAILTLGGSSFSLSRDDFKQVVPREKLVLVGTDRVNLADGALFSYGANNYELGKQSTEYLFKALHGVDPGTLPVLQADKIEFLINQKLADQFGRQLPDTVLSSADELVK